MKSGSVRAVAKTVLLIAWLPILAPGEIPGSGPANPTAAAGPAVPPYVSPEVNSVHTVPFRLRAPNAQKVEVVLEGAVSPMQQGAEGLWTATSPVLTPEIYSYHFVIDGTSFLDPRNTHVVNNLLNLASDVT